MGTDTDPIEVTDLSCLDTIGKVLIKSLRHEVLQLRAEKTKILDLLADRERELAERDKDNAMIRKEVCSNKR